MQGSPHLGHLSWLPPLPELLELVLFPLPSPTDFLKGRQRLKQNYFQEEDEFNNIDKLLFPSQTLVGEQGVYKKSHCISIILPFHHLHLSSHLLKQNTQPTLRRTSRGCGVPDEPHELPDGSVTVTGLWSLIFLCHIHKHETFRREFTQSNNNMMPVIKSYYLECLYRTLATKSTHYWNRNQISNQ